MARIRTAIVAVLAMLVGLVAPAPAAPWHTAPSARAASPFAVTTQRDDNGRSGLDLQETTLTPASVNQATFGKLFARTVDGQLYAQPLYVPNVAIPGKGTHNVVILATMHDSVYAYDADDPAQSSPLWQVSLGTPIPVPDGCFGTRYGTGFNFMNPEVGIVSTPAIDLSTGTIYAVSTEKGKPSGLGSPCDPTAYAHRLHALDLATGQEKFGGPVAVAATAPGTGADSAGGTLTLSNMQELQRASLLLANGLVYVPFASYADTDPYHGWVLAYDAATLAPRSTWVATPNPDGTGSYEGGIWQSGQGLATDASGSLYANIGNGNWDGTADFGDSVVKFGPSLGVLDWFTPYNQGTLAASDLDLGSSGALPMTGTTRLLAGGKQGVLYLLNQASLGHVGSGSDSQIPQSWQATSGQIQGTPLCWSGPSYWCYLWGSGGDTLKQYAYTTSSGLFATTPAHQSTMGGSGGEPGGFLALSANGASGGILWASAPLSGDAGTATVPGVLRAFDATNVGTELWDSQQNSARDGVGSFAKFVPPTVANGKVYLATFSGALDVYGLLPPSPTATASPTPIPAQAAINAGGPAVAPFAADSGFSGGNTYNYPNDQIATSGAANPAPMAVYQTGRYGNFTYTMSGLTPGAAYTVRTHYAEIWWGIPGRGSGGAGSRLFNLAINGTQVLTNYDVYAAAGGADKAVTAQSTANADAAGKITLTFTTVRDNAMVSGIEVAPAVPPTSTPTPTATSTPTNTATATATPLPHCPGTEPAGTYQLEQTVRDSGGAILYDATGPCAAP